MAMGAARSTRSEPKQGDGHKLAVTTGVSVNQEQTDDDEYYESLLAPAFDENGYDQINDVEVVATSHTCPFCHKGFKRKGMLQSHLTQAHPDQKNVTLHRCPHCECSASDRESLKSHIIQSHPAEVRMRQLLKEIYQQILLEATYDILWGAKGYCYLFQLQGNIHQHGKFEASQEGKLSRIKIHFHVYF